MKGDLGVIVEGIMTQIGSIHQFFKETKGKIESKIQEQIFDLKQGHKKLEEFLNQNTKNLALNSEGENNRTEACQKIIRKFPLQRKGLKEIVKDLDQFDQKLSEFHQQFFEEEIKPVNRKTQPRSQKKICQASQIDQVGRPTEQNFRKKTYKNNNSSQDKSNMTKTDSYFFNKRYKTSRKTQNLIQNQNELELGKYPTLNKEKRQNDYLVKYSLNQDQMKLQERKNEITKQLVEKLQARNKELEKKCILRKNYIKKIYQIIENSDNSTNLQKMRIIGKFTDFCMQIEGKIQNLKNLYENKLQEQVKRCQKLVQKIKKTQKPLFQNSTISLSIQKSFADPPLQIRYLFPKQLKNKIKCLKEDIGALKGERENLKNLRSTLSDLKARTTQTNKVLVEQLKVKELQKSLQIKNKETSSMKIMIDKLRENNKVLKAQFKEYVECETIRSFQKKNTQDAQNKENNFCFQYQPFHSPNQQIQIQLQIRDMKLKLYDQVTSRAAAVICSDQSNYLNLEERIKSLAKKLLVMKAVHTESQIVLKNKKEEPLQQMTIKLQKQNQQMQNANTSNTEQTLLREKLVCKLKELQTKNRIAKKTFSFIQKQFLKIVQSSQKQFADTLRKIKDNQLRVKKKNQVLSMHDEQNQKVISKINENLTQLNMQMLFKDQRLKTLSDQEEKAKKMLEIQSKNQMEQETKLESSLKLIEQQNQNIEIKDRLIQNLEDENLHLNRKIKQLKMSSQDKPQKTYQIEMHKILRKKSITQMKSHLDKAIKDLSKTVKNISPEVSISDNFSIIKDFIATQQKSFRNLVFMNTSRLKAIKSYIEQIDSRILDSLRNKLQQNKQVFFEVQSKQKWETIKQFQEKYNKMEATIIEKENDISLKEKVINEQKELFQNLNAAHNSLKEQLQKLDNDKKTLINSIQEACLTMNLKPKPDASEMLHDLCFLITQEKQISLNQLKDVKERSLSLCKHIKIALRTFKSEILQLQEKGIQEKEFLDNWVEKLKRNVESSKSSPKMTRKSSQKEEGVANQEFIDLQERVEDLERQLEMEIDANTQAKIDWEKEMTLLKKEHQGQMAEAENKIQELEKLLSQIKKPFKIERQITNNSDSKKREKQITDFTITNENQSLIDVQDLKEQNDKNIELILSLYDKITFYKNQIDGFKSKKIKKHQTSDFFCFSKTKIKFSTIQMTYSYFNPYCNLLGKINICSSNNNQQFIEKGYVFRRKNLIQQLIKILLKSKIMYSDEVNKMGFQKNQNLLNPSESGEQLKDSLLNMTDDNQMFSEFNSETHELLTILFNMIKMFFNLSDDSIDLFHEDPKVFLQILKEKMIQWQDLLKSTQDQLKNHKKMLDAKCKETVALQSCIKELKDEKELFEKISHNECSRDGISQFLDENLASQHIYGGDNQQTWELIKANQELKDKLLKYEQINQELSTQQQQLKKQMQMMKKEMEGNVLDLSLCIEQIKNSYSQFLNCFLSGNTESKIVYAIFCSQLNMNTEERETSLALLEQMAQKNKKYFFQ